MIKINPTNDQDLIKEIITSHGLYESLTGGQDVSPDEWNPVPGHVYLLIYDDVTVYGLYDVYLFVSDTYFVHSAILPKYWGTGISNEAAQVAEDYLADNGVKKLLAPVPEKVRPVRKFVERIGFSLEGYIPKGITYQDQEMGLCMYGKYIKRGDE